jgi:two-component sensor histidine kinase
MHPILASPRRLLLYLLSWTAIFALLVAVTWESSSAPWSQAAAALAPACALLAFICLSPFYICRSLPIGPSSAPNLILTFGGAAAAGGLIFAWIAWETALALDRTAPFRGIGALRTHVPIWFAIGVLLYLLSAGLHYAALAVGAARQAERRAAEARTLAREAELQALRMQINPHFLFNSLHSISALTGADAARAREMCVRLAAFLRTSLGLGDRANIPLSEELALARAYLEVERVRFGARLSVEEEIEPECEACGVPALLLQPLVENAVKHGIAGLVEGGPIRLTARRRGSAVAITLENAFDPEASAPGKMGIGLSHVRRRLQVRYGDDAEFAAGPAGAVYRVELRFPCESPIASSSRA